MRYLSSLRGWLALNSLSDVGGKISINYCRRLNILELYPYSKYQLGWDELRTKSVKNRKYRTWSETIEYLPESMECLPLADIIMAVLSDVLLSLPCSIRHIRPKQKSLIIYFRQNLCIFVKITKAESRQRLTQTSMLSTRGDLFIGHR